MKRLTFLILIFLAIPVVVHAQETVTALVHYYDPNIHGDFYHFAALVKNVGTGEKKLLSHYLYEDFSCEWDVALSLPYNGEHFNDIVGFSVRHRLIFISYSDGSTWMAEGTSYEGVCIPPSSWELIHDFPQEFVATNQSTWGDIKKQFKKQK